MSRLSSLIVTSVLAISFMGSAVWADDTKNLQAGKSAMVPSTAVPEIRIPVDILDKMPDTVRQQLEDFKNSRESFLKQQKELIEKWKENKDQRVELRNQMREKLQDLMQKRQELRSSIKESIENLRDKLTDQERDRIREQIIEKIKNRARENDADSRKIRP